MAGAEPFSSILLLQLKVALTINELNKRFYDVWSDPGRHYLAEAYAAILPFLWTGVTLVLVSTIASYVTSKFVLWWREAVTFHYLDLARTSRRSSKVQASGFRKMWPVLPRSWKPSR